MRLSKSVLLATLASTASADVLFTSPAAGVTIPTGGETQVTIPITWKESGTAPALSALAGYTIALMAGGNDAASMMQVAVLVTNGNMASGAYTASGVSATGVGGSTANAYFLKITSAATSGGQVINYSSRFTLSGMTGTFAPAIAAGIAAVSGTAGPATQNSVTNNAGAAAAVDGGMYAVPYLSQTGTIRYAPMQGMPPTKITAAKNPSPLFPTSAFTIATTYLGAPTILTTMTASQTFSVQSVENPAAAASQPTGDMKRFLERWKD